MECRPSKGNKERLVTYSEAKAEALRQLEEFVTPYLKRIDELRRDEFEEAGKLPKYKAWVKRGMIVVARSQVRAAELLHSNTYDIRNYYKPAHDDWWYRYAAEESVWIEVQTERGRGTGEYIKMLSNEEARAILQEELAKYETMPLAQLAGMIGHEDMIERSCSEGSVGVIVKVCRYDWEPSVIQVEGRRNVSTCLRHLRDGISVLWTRFASGFPSTWGPAPRPPGFSQASLGCPRGSCWSGVEFGMLALSGETESGSAGTQPGEG